MEEEQRELTQYVEAPISESEVREKFEKKLLLKLRKTWD